jgi:glycosyltransferase involved in cell wall biosynthesis
VFVASAELLRRRGSSNPRTHVVPHGVPPRPARAAPEPEALRGLPRPRVGFVGSISEWTDLDLVRGLAEARADWSFVLVGPVKAKADRLRGKPNLLLTGERPHEEIPGFLAAFDAAIIPYRVTPATEAASPVKLREYLAQGLPVVSVDVPEVRPFSPPVELAAGVDGFVEALERAIARGRGTPAREAAPGWASRVDEMIAKASEALAASRR